MAFDPSSAKPVDNQKPVKTGFDPSSSKPYVEEAPKSRFRKKVAAAFDESAKSSKDWPEYEAYLKEFQQTAPYKAKPGEIPLMPEGTIAPAKEGLPLSYTDWQADIKKNLGAKAGRLVAGTLDTAGTMAGGLWDYLLLGPKTAWYGGGEEAMKHPFWQPSTDIAEDVMKALSWIPAYAAHLPESGVLQRMSHNRSLKKLSEPSSAPIVDNLRKTPPPEPDLGAELAQSRYADDRTVERLQHVLDKKNEPLPPLQVLPEGQALLPEQAKTRNVDLAQQAVEARQRALEQGVKEQTPNIAAELEYQKWLQERDAQAQERGRLFAQQEQGTNFLGKHLTEQAAAEAQQTHDFVSQLKQDEIDATPYGEPPAQYGFTPEHGRPDVQSNLFGREEMPIRADLSMEAQNLQNPLQRNLWGDELGPAQGAERSLTEAIDQMPWAQRRGAIKSELANDVPVSPELQEAINLANEEANRSRPAGIGPGRGRLNRGATTIFNDLDDLVAKFLRIEGKGFDKDQLQRLKVTAEKLEEYKNLYPELSVSDLMSILDEGSNIIYGADGYNRYSVDPNGNIKPLEGFFHSKDKLKLANDILNEGTSGIGPGKVGRYPGITRGGIDPKMFKQGFKALTKWHDRLTNQPWLKEAFPAHSYETNPDGTPYVIFHGTIKAFDDRPKSTTSEGLHAGSITPATIKAYKRKDPYTYGATLWQMKVAESPWYFEGEIMPDGQPAGKVSAGGSAVYPMVIRKGNYLTLDVDAANWSPSQLISNTQFLVDFGKKTGKGYYTVKDALNNWWDTIGQNIPYENEAKAFGKFLKSEFGVDGFWYPNEYESVKRSYTMSLGQDNPSWSRAAKYDRAANAVDHPTSFVTYNDNNLRPIFDLPQKTTLSHPTSVGGPKGLKQGSTRIYEDLFAAFENISRKVRGGTPEDAFLARTLRDDSFLARGEDPKTVIEAAKGQEDGPSLWTDLQSGPQLASKKVNKAGQESALVSGVARWLHWQEKKGTKDVLEHVIPMERYLSKISRKELELAMDVKIEMQRAALEGIKYTDEQLRAAGASEQTITTIKKMKELDDFLLNRVNEGRAAVGKKPIDGQSAYFSSQWRGNWHLPVKDKDGNLVGYIRTMTRREANKAKEWVKQNHPEWVMPPKPEYKKSGHVMDRIGGSVVETFDTLLEAFKGTPMELELQKGLENAREEMGYRSNRFDVHLVPKSGVRFFMGDRPWLSKHENAVEAARSQIDYYKEGLRWSALQEAVKPIKEILADPELIEKQPNNMDIANAYTQHALGLTEDLTRSVVNYVSKVTGLSPGHFGILANDFKTFTYLVQLSMSAGYAIAAPLQAFLLGPGYHSTLSLQGYKHNPIKTFASAWLDGTAILKSHVWRELTDKEPANLKLSALGEAAKRYMEDNGIIDANLFDDYGNIGEHRVMTGLKNTLGRTISEPEKVSRVMTFMSYVHHLAEGGHPVSIELFKKADDLTNNTLTNFSRNARPLVVDKTGALGELSYVYKSPAVNYYNGLSVFARQAKEGKSLESLMPFVYSALIMPLLLGGVMNIPGISELDGILNIIQWAMANIKPEYYQKVKDINIREFALANFHDALTYGPLSHYSGVNLSTRFSNQLINPEKPFSLAAPIRQELTEQKSMVEFLTHPTKHTLAEGIYKNVPPMPRGWMELGLPIYNAGERDGKTLYRNPYNITEPEASYARTGAEEALRLGGLVSLDEYRSKEARYSSKKTTGFMKDARTKALEILSDAIIRDDVGDIKKYAKVYFENNGDEGEFQRTVTRNLERAYLTPMERQTKGAKRLSEIMDLVHHMRLRGEIK